MPGSARHRSTELASLWPYGGTDLRASMHSRSAFWRDTAPSASSCPFSLLTWASCKPLLTVSVLRCYGSDQQPLQRMTAQAASQATHQLPHESACMPTTLQGHAAAKQRQAARHTGLPDSSVSRSAEPRRIRLRLRWLSGFWSKKSLMKRCVTVDMAAARLPRISAMVAAWDRSSTTCSPQVEG